MIWWTSDTGSQNGQGEGLKCRSPKESGGLKGRVGVHVWENRMTTTETWFFVIMIQSSRVEAIASRLEAIASRVEAIASRVKAIAVRVEAIAIRVKATAVGWRPLLLG